MHKRNLTGIIWPQTPTGSILVNVKKSPSVNKRIKKPGGKARKINK